MRTYTDEHIEYWADFFVNNNFQYTGITFEEFMVLPKEYTEAITFDHAMPLQGDFYPLLPEQKQVQEQLDADDEGRLIQEEMDTRFERQGHVIEMHGPRTIEPMHHRDTPKKWKTNTRTA